MMSIFAESMLTLIVSAVMTLIGGGILFLIIRAEKKNQQPPMPPQNMPYQNAPYQGVAPQPIKYCQNCGNAVRVDANFCDKCGSRV